MSSLDLARWQFAIVTGCRYLSVPLPAAAGLIGRGTFAPWPAGRSQDKLLTIVTGGFWEGPLGRPPPRVATTQRTSR